MVKSMEHSDPTVYELPLTKQAVRTARPATRWSEGALPQALLVKYVTWFCQLRWVVILILLTFGMVCLRPPTVLGLTLRSRPLWPWVTAACLILANVCFLLHVRLSSRSGTPNGAAGLWCQIIVDLVVLTAVVHAVGIHETCVPFAYVFHIVLACIFFSGLQSLAVTALACALLTACAVGEFAGVLPAASIYADATIPRADIPVGVFVTRLASYQAAWVVVWYLTSHLSALVRRRDLELAEANQRLVSSQSERASHMLRVTHELKSPFAAIHANTQLLLEGYCGVIPEGALPVLQRISARSRRLAVEIQDMLQLANLNSPSIGEVALVDLDLVAVLDWCVSHVKALAESRKVALRVSSTDDSLPVLGVEDHLKMLFSNLMMNAVTYSHEGGTVTVDMEGQAERGAVVQIRDRGLGIPANKLPRIFEEFYRTSEALQHWHESTGLGLAIVRDVARTHGFRVRVSSKVGEGTTVRVVIPPAEAIASGTTTATEGALCRT